MGCRIDAHVKNFNSFLGKWRARRVEQPFHGAGITTLRFWESPTPLVVLGRGSDVSTEVRAEVCASEKIPVLRRVSGGGTVVLGPGCLNFSLVLSLELRPELLGVQRSYEIILGTVISALGKSKVTLGGLSDLISAHRKISGNAQKRTRRVLLHQGTILHDFDTSLLARFLRPPPRQPAYRTGRSHTEFVTNLPMAVDRFKRRLFEVWQGGVVKWPASSVGSSPGVPLRGDGQGHGGNL